METVFCSSYSSLPSFFRSWLYLGGIWPCDSWLLIVNFHTFKSISLSLSSWGKTLSLYSPQRLFLLSLQHTSFRAPDLVWLQSLALQNSPHGLLWRVMFTEEAPSYDNFLQWFTIQITKNFTDIITCFVLILNIWQT